MRIFIALAFGLLPYLPGPAGAAYLLDTGDVVEISVLGVADYRRRVTVNVDGEVALPILGEVAAAGSSIGDLRRRLAAKLGESRVIQSADVTVELVEYRPFYVSGDVARPGAVPYRPRMTARIAIALAGGYDALRFRSENPLLLAPELRGQHETLWVELIRKQARATTLQAETDGKDAANLGALSDAPLPRGTVATVADTELRDLKARSADFARQRAFQERALDQIKANVSALEASQQQQTATVNRQAEAGERIAASYARGVSPVMRVEEDNRSLAGLRSQLIETTARLVVARKELDEGARSIERLVEDRRQRLLRETQDTFVETERLRAQVRATGEKLLYTGAINAQLRRGAKGPELVVHRKVEGRAVAQGIDEDAEILPGDVVDVVIRPDQAVLSPSH